MRRGRPVAACGACAAGRRRLLLTFGTPSQRPALFAAPNAILNCRKQGRASELGEQTGRSQNVAPSHGPSFQKLDESTLIAGPLTTCQELSRTRPGGLGGS